MPATCHQASEEDSGVTMLTHLTRRLHRLTSTGGIFSTTSSATMPAAYVQGSVIVLNLGRAMAMLAWQTKPNFVHCCNGLTWCL